MRIDLFQILLLYVVSSDSALAAQPAACLAPQKNLSVKDFGAKADGHTDDTAAIQAALDVAKAGDVLLFPEGHYKTSKSLQVKTSSIALVGQNATLFSLTPGDQSIHISGEHVAVVGMRLEGTGATRLAANNSAKIFSESNYVQLIDNTIVGGASVGILVHGGHDFIIRGNHIENTLADGIHMTHGASKGIVSDNSIKNSGDDMIAVVSYKKHLPLATCSDILIKDNHVSGNKWGRGISVIGGTNITIDSNQIEDVNEAAGILIAQEDVYNTMNTEHIVVQNNSLTNIQMPPWARNKPAHHAALNIDTGPSGSVMYVLFKNNTVNGSYFGGMRWRGNTCHDSSVGNHFDKISGDVFTMRQIACPATENVCRGNTGAGNAFEGCPNTGDILATGSLYLSASDEMKPSYPWAHCLDE